MLSAIKLSKKSTFGGFLLKIFPKFKRTGQKAPRVSIITAARTPSSNRDEGGREEEGTEHQEVEDRLFGAGLLTFLLLVVRCPEEHVHEANRLIVHLKLRAHPTTGSNSAALGA